MIEGDEKRWYFLRRDGRDRSIAYMAEDGIITRIDVFNPRGTKARVRTSAGIGVGSSRADLETAYGDRLKLEAHPIAPGVQWVVIERIDAGGIRVVLQDGAVSVLFAARGPALGYPEGCS